MKNALIIFMILCTIVSMTACAGNSSTTTAATTAASTEAVTSAPATEATTEPTETTMQPTETEAPALPDGVYSATFDTDSSMFHINEVYEGKGTLTVKDGKMTMHIVLAGSGVLQIFIGTKEDAQKDGAVLCDAQKESVTYSDGFTDTVLAFDIPVPVLDEEFDCAIIGKKGTWYDHKVSVSDPVLIEE